MNSPKIVIIIEAGMVSAVYANHPDLEVLIKDYDTEGVATSALETDASGESFRLTEEMSIYKPDLVNEFFKERTRD